MGLLDKLNPDRFTSVNDLLVTDDVETVISALNDCRRLISKVVVVFMINDVVYAKASSDDIASSVGMIEMAKGIIMEDSEGTRIIEDDGGILKHKSYDDNGNLLEGDEDEKI